MTQFARYIGIDYSGAETPSSSLPGLRIYVVDTSGMPEEISPPPGPRKYWTRRGLAEWLLAALRLGPPTLVGIDHAFSFPLRYFETHRLPPDWPLFLDDFHQHWPTDEENTYVDFVRKGVCGDGARRCGDSRWRRLAEQRCKAKSVFHFDVQGSVAKSTHAGLPWLRHLRRRLGDKVLFWPFDGWKPPAGTSVIAEVYPALWNRAIPTMAATPINTTPTRSPFGCSRLTPPEPYPGLSNRSSNLRKERLPKLKAGSLASRKREVPRNRS